MQLVSEDQVKDWASGASPLAAYREAIQSFGPKGLDDPSPLRVRRRLGIGPALGLAIETLLAEDPKTDAHALASIPLHSMARGIYLPLSGMTADAVGNLFGFQWQAPETDETALVQQFIDRDLGLSLPEKIGVLMGDPFGGQPSGVGFDSLVAVLARLTFLTTQDILTRLPRIGDMGLLFIEHTEAIRSDPPITAREALCALRGLPRISLRQRREVLLDLFGRAGRLERYLLYRLLRRRLATGLRFKMELIWRAVGQRYRCDPDRIINAAAIHDHLDLARIIETEGPEGLKRIVLRPLNPVVPALAGGQLEPSKASWPLWIERKYDGIRIMAHRQVDSRGQPLVALYTRRKRDWTMMLPELAQTISQLPVPGMILDGELHGEILTIDGLRQATVYDVYKAITNQDRSTVRFRYTAFDLLYLNGQDLTDLPLTERRLKLEQLFGPCASWPLPMPFGISDGQLARDHNQFKVLFQHFRNQGFEGAIAKKQDAPYQMGRRTSDWMKKKPEITLDLPITGAFWSGREDGQPNFGSFRLSARSQTDNSWREVCTVNALDAQTNQQLAERIMSGNLFTGRTLTHDSAQGKRAGFEVMPEIMVTVQFEGVVRDKGDSFSLRDPRIVAIRNEELTPDDADTAETIEGLYLRERLA